MTKAEMIQKVETINELTELLEEVKAEIAGLEDEIKNQMNEENTEVLDLDTYFIRWVQISSSRFNTKLFKEKMGEDVYKAFCKEVPSRRFTITAA